MRMFYIYICVRVTFTVQFFFLSSLSIQLTHIFVYSFLQISEQRLSIEIKCFSKYLFFFYFGIQ